MLKSIDTARLRQIKPNPIKPREIVDPLTLQVTNLDDISVKLSKLIDITAINQKYLNAILKELRDEADEGEFLTIIDTATTTDFYFYETTTAPGHPVKGYAISNEGPNTIYVAHNTTKAGLQPSIDDVTSRLSRFQQILSGEEVRYIFNRRKIYNIAMLAKDADSIFRMWLTW